MDSNHLRIVVIVGLVMVGVLGLWMLKRCIQLLWSSARVVLIVAALGGLAAVFWWSQRSLPPADAPPQIYQSQQSPPLQR